jgi:hypothetical protein
MSRSAQRAKKKLALLFASKNNPIKMMKKSSKNHSMNLEERLKEYKKKLEKEYKKYNQDYSRVNNYIDALENPIIEEKENEQTDKLN